MLPGLRELKARARMDLHQAMQVPCFCIPVRTGLAKPVDVRVHTEFAAHGDVKGTSFVYAERRESEDQIIFLAAQHQPDRGDVVIVSAQEGYKIDNVDPQYNITIRATVVAMKPAEIAKYPKPPGPAVYGIVSGLLGRSASEASNGLGAITEAAGLLSESAALIEYL